VEPPKSGPPPGSQAIMAKKLEIGVQSRYEVPVPLNEIAARFEHRGKITDIREWGSGNVNDTFLVTLDDKKDEHYILQRLNTRVFPRPELVMLNMRVVTEHIRGRLEHATPSGRRRWEVVRVLPACDGQDHWTDPLGSFWRAITFIGDALSFDTIQSEDHAREVGRGLGMFQSLISDLPVERLADTIDGFHITPRYIRHYDEVLETKPALKSAEVAYCLRFVSERRSWAHILESAREQGQLRLRPIHGDPKVNNVLMDCITGQAVSIIDLDTVKPGLIHYDIGDCLRSSCNLQGEETKRWEAVRFEPDICREILQGYLPLARDFLTLNDHRYMYDAIRLIAFELGLRFLTDYLEGDVYFKANHPEHNLCRALVQFRLTESIESQASVIGTILRDMR
jgi:hypothetical protein